MKFLLDTDIVSRIDRAGNDKLSARFRDTKPDDLAMSVITLGEIEFGLKARGVGQKTRQRMRGLLSRIATLPLTANVAQQYGGVRDVLRAAGTPIGYNDLWIAAHALSEDLTVVTNNEREFRRVSGLKVENWLNPS